MTRTIDIFISYAPKDKKLREQLEGHLKLLKREGIVNAWHDQNIGAGAEWKPAIATHLNTADIILLLMSSHFISSDSCYEEMCQALERHKTGEAHVILVVLRPIDWKETPAGDLPVLPTDGKPITTWRNRDEAFSQVGKGIHAIVKELGIEQLKEKPLLPSLEPAKSSLNSNITENGGNALDSRLLASSRLAIETKESLLGPLSNTGGQQQSLAKKKLWQSLLHLSRRKAFKVLAGLTIATGASVSLLEWIVTQAQSNNTPQTTNLPQSVQDQNLSVQFIGIQQSAIALPDNPARLSISQLPKLDVPALCIDQQKQQSVFRIAIGISNLRKDQYELLIEQVQLNVEKIIPLPRPLYVLVQSSLVQSNQSLYLASYTGQDPNTYILTKYDNPSYNYVFLVLNETDKISVQVVSSVPVFLSFRVAITYRVNNEGQTHTLTLPNPFQVIFSDKSNWHPYQQLRDGRFTQLDAP